MDCPPSIFPSGGRVLLGALVAVLIGWEVFDARVQPRGGVPPPVRLTPTRAAAIVYYGLTGYMHPLEQRYHEAWTPSADAARVGFASVREHVLSSNAARGWRCDVFFHTWHEELEGELVTLTRPAAHAIGGTVSGYGAAAGGGAMTGYGMLLSMEMALDIVRRHVDGSRGGAPYARVLLLRFDTLFLRDFELDKLSNASAVYVANWCKAHGRVLLREPISGAEGRERECAELVANANDLDGPAHGVPDFFFAGAFPPVWRLFHGLHAWMLTRPHFASDFHKGAMPHAHFVLGERLLEQRAVVRRYLHHHMDLDMVRERNCAGPGRPDTSRAACEGAGHAWLNRRDDDVSNTSRSLCNRGEAYCACSKYQAAHCYAFVG